MATQDWHTPMPQTLGDKVALAVDTFTAVFTPASWERSDFTLHALAAPFRRRHP